jgi:hypothetical protein
VTTLRRLGLVVAGMNLGIACAKPSMAFACVGAGALLLLMHWPERPATTDTREGK